MNESLEEYLAYEEIDEDIYWSDWSKNPTDLDFEEYLAYEEIDEDIYWSDWSKNPTDLDFEDPYE